MDTEAQKRAIIDKLVGAPAGTLPPLAAFDEPWRTIYRRLTPAKNLLEATLLLWEATGDLEDGLSAALQLFDLLPGDDAFTPFSSLPQSPATGPTPQEMPASNPSGQGLSPHAPYPSLHEISVKFPAVEWLWLSWIPRGMVTLFAAAPGAGKSLVALDLARRIIHDEPFPDGAPVPDPGRNVLIVDADGDPALITQRARAWDIDLRRLYLMRAPSTAGTATNRRFAPDLGTLVDLYRPEQMTLLIRMVAQLRPALVIIDSLAAATSRSEASIQGARDLLGGLSLLAREARLALLVIHHLRKSTRSGGSAPARVAADDLRGSSHLSAAARSVLALSLLTPPASPTPDLSETSRPSSSVLRPSRRLKVVKTNLCRLPPPLALTFEGEDAVVPTLRYTEYSEPPPPPTQLELCARWLLHYLTAAAAPVKPAEVVRAAVAEGFPRQTLYRARRSLAGTVVDLGNRPHDPHKRWTLAPEPSPPAEDHP